MLSKDTIRLNKTKWCCNICEYLASMLPRRIPAETNRIDPSHQQHHQHQCERKSPPRCGFRERS